MTEHYYVYAIQAHDTSLPATLTGLAGNSVKSVRQNLLSAAVSVIDASEVSPTIENVLLHEAVVETAREFGKTIPVRFGTIFDSDDAVGVALDARQDGLLSDLERLGDKLEIGVTIMWDPPACIASENGTMPDRHPTTPGDGTRYMRARLMEHRHETTLRHEAQRLADQLTECVGQHSLDQRQSVVPAPRLAVRAVYLLEMGQIAGFRDAVEVLRSQHAGLRYLVSGPWPPYSFVTPGRANITEGFHRLVGGAGRLVAPGGI